MEEDTTLERLLVWDKPPAAVPPAEHMAYHGGGVAGAYAPNMDSEWKLRWKAKLCGQKSDALRVEIRKSTRDDYAGTVQIVIMVFETGGVVMSMNGKAGFSQEEFLEMPQAVSEAVSAIKLYRARQRGNPLSPPYEELAGQVAGSGDAS